MAGKQNKIPGFTELEDDDVEALAEDFAKIRDEWQAKGVEMNKAKKALLEGAKKNKKLLDAAKAHPRGKVKVGDALLTIKAKNPTLDIKVKLYGEEGSEPGGEQEAAE